MRNFLRGLKFNFQGFGYFVARPTLWKFAVIPMLITILAFGGFSYFALNFYDDLYLFLSKPLASLDVAQPEGLLTYLLDFVAWIARAIMQILVFMLSALFVIFAGYLVSLIVNGPFYELMAEKVLVLEGKRVASEFTFRGFFSELVFGFKAEITKTGFYLVVSVILIALSFLPAIGVIFTIFQFLFSCWYFAFGLSTFPFVLQRTSLKEIFSWGARHKMLLMGFGLPAMIPFAGLFLMTFQVVGATLLYLSTTNE